MALELWHSSNSDNTTFSVYSIFQISTYTMKVFGKILEKDSVDCIAPINTSAVLSCGKACSVSVPFTKGLFAKFLNLEGHLAVLLYIFFHHKDWVFLRFMWSFRGTLHNSKTTRGQFLFHKMAASEWRKMLTLFTISSLSWEIRQRLGLWWHVYIYFTVSVVLVRLILDTIFIFWICKDHSLVYTKKVLQ